MPRAVKAGRTYVGVSGFSYASWRGTFYPPETKTEEFLAYYSENLGSVEINSTFYAPPKEATVKSWAERTGENFRFAFKAPQLITHVLKLGKGASEAARRFSERLEVLGPRRGPVLFQLPPYFRHDEKLLSDFLSKTSTIPSRVFEFRHESWFQETVFDMLDDNDVAFCASETENMEPVLRATGGIGYFRLRKDAYDSAAVEMWAGTIREMRKGLRETYVYLRHDETGENALHAQRLSQLLP